MVQDYAYYSESVRRVIVRKAVVNLSLAVFVSEFSVDVIMSPLIYYAQLTP
jgi:hypothetical protein